MTDDEIDELREQTRGADRISADATDGDEETDGKETTEVTEENAEMDAEDTGDKETVAGPTPSEGFADTLAGRAERTDAGVDPRSFSADDPGLSALLLALQDTGEIDAVGEALRDALGAPEPPEYDRDAVVRLALTYALSEEAPAYLEELASP
ncbi:MAG: hypothetical protein ACLFR5_03495 [Halobacteriales archaeon]